MKLELRELPDGEFEVYDTENEITVDTSLDRHWMECLVVEGTLNLERFDKASLIKIINLLV
jgi:hypothetical protein